MRLLIVSKLVQEIHYSDSALKYYQEAINLAKLLKNKELQAQNLNRLGVYFRNMNLQEDALNLYEQALELSLESGEKSQIGHSYNNIGQMYYYKDYFDEALDYYKQAEQIFIEIDDKNGLGYNYTGMSLVLAELGRYQEALEKIDKAIDLRDKLGQTRQLMVSKFNKADILMDLGNFYEAENDILKLYDYGINNDKVRAINALEKLVELKIKTGDQKAAISYAEMAQEIHQQKPFSESMIRIYQLINQVYFNLGNIEKSQEYQNLLQAERNVIKSEKTKVHLAALTIQKQKEEIEFLSREKDLLDQNEKFKLFLLFGLIVSLMIITVAYLTVYRALNREKINLAKLYEQNKKIENQSKDLEKLNRMKDKIFSILAHDLKGPLNSLSGLVKLIQEDNLTQEEFVSYIPLLAENLGNNNILLENLLVWSRSQMNGLEANYTRLNIQSLVQKNIEYLHYSGYYKGQILTNDLDENVWVVADKNMVEIIIRNLLSNALKFTKKSDHINISAYDEHDKLTIRVDDNGVGIMQENLSRLFDSEFFSTMGTHQEKGTGIGLILTKELVQINNGKIWVESEYGTGSSFYFNLPKA
ncbi:tetratricopeptide repeat-containing sensor histidine kinase [Belliella sp. DSM 107340]|uniref:histidine kinase n=1 Tax=Belliella calami TaxID=2923436 RepID=A0ABS9US79_9BACT|nr:ATP-binding protein [Belliella calami]MCH7399485.1 tetratricopeptide repeat-containing sensor histidine kinase [Belliella calami]